MTLLRLIKIISINAQQIKSSEPHDKETHVSHVTREV